ncbi:hypothetical protein AB0N16_28435 [Streptomyces sp. NPDC051105]|uniref:hypothetical protein n=1 Tax=Streptomyces sp. NPDC051105 TaxID=3154843 RepID=UPI003434A958
MHFSPRPPAPDHNPPAGPTAWPVRVQRPGLVYLLHGTRYGIRADVIGLVVMPCDNPCCSPRPPAPPSNEPAVPIRVTSGTAEAKQAARPRITMTRFPLH